jgi:hypothetical protein
VEWQSGPGQAGSAVAAANRMRGSSGGRLLGVVPGQPMLWGLLDLATVLQQ